MRGDRLREVREARHLSQRELAALCGFGENQIHRYENGGNLNADTLAVLAKHLDVTADYLLGLTDEPTGHITEDDLSPMERKLISAVRRGMITEALETFTTLSKKND